MENWLKCLRTALHALGVELVECGDGALAKRMDSADFFEVALRSGNLTVWVALHVTAVEGSPLDTAVSLVSGEYSAADAVSEWHWSRR